MLTNFGSMALDRIHNTLKVRMISTFPVIFSFCKAVFNVSPYTFLQMFCIADPPYDKTLQQLQSFLSGLVSEEKLEVRDGMYVLKK